MLTLNTIFDNTYYLQNNPDVATLVATGTYSSGFEHFQKVGKYEGRDPNAIFNTAYYLSTNTDVASAVNQNKTTAIDHFILHGQYEGRNPHPVFDTRYYLTNNPDVATAVRQNKLTTLQHFLQLGQFEGRNPSAFFDTNYYLNKYPEVNVAIKNGVVKSAFSHYLTNGIFEGRLTTAPAASDNLNNAIALGSLTDVKSVNGSLNDKKSTDIYSFILNTPSKLSLRLDGLNGDADLALIQDLNGNGEIGSDDVIAESQNFGIVPENLAPPQTLFPGNYFVRVSQEQGNTNYNLTIAPQSL
ncbi:MAG: PPC domain-containing protein [Microcoleaceae cyanobacterium]|jgi:hypothetical protein